MEALAERPGAEADAAPTKEAYGELLDAYKHFNRELFEGKLPGALITLQRSSRFYGYFSRRRFVNSRSKDVTDELAMNPAAFAVRPIESVLSTLAHEMCHQYQNCFGEPSRRGYHNREFAELMKKIGLQTSDTGRPGGKEVGEKMSHYILSDGPFIQSVKRLLATDFALSWLDRYPMAIPSSMVDEAPDDAYADEDEEEKARRSAAASSSPLPATEPLPFVTEGEPPDEGILPGEAGFRVENDPFARRTSLPAQDDPQAGAQPAPAAVPLSAPPAAASDLDIELPKMTRSDAPKKTREKFVCPGCNDAAWGKRSLKLICGKCNEPFKGVDFDVDADS